MKKKSLISNLILINSITLFLGFYLIYFSVNYVIKDYVHQMTRNSMQANFTILDSIYNNKKIPDENMVNQDSIFVWSYYAIFDQHYRMKYGTDNHKKESHDIIRYLTQKRLWQISKEKDGMFVTIKKKTYYVMTKDYSGILVDGSIKKVPKAQSQLFHVINFSDITYTQHLITKINHFLIVILVLTYIPMLFIMRKTFTGIRESIQSVQTYISSLWKNQGNHQSSQKEIVFSDFDPLLLESQEMANRIYQAEESQRNFFQNASHELRTPLMSIQGYTEGVQEGIIDAELAHSVILQESKKMKQLVDDIILLSKLDSNLSDQKDEFSLNELLNSIIAYFKPLANKQKISITYRPDKHEKLLKGNEELIQRAINNILSNALRYAVSHIEISYTNQKLTISNDGPAISKEDLPYIFDRFYKGHGSQTGIGLAMTKEIIKQHHGNIIAESDSTSTTFTIYFNCHKIA
ncbi:sensor histidine kinase [Streptococcus agalactiae]|uniref:sensor histidine kinase n=1 Tax=Streptococcus agalactiae TaxID=1311 RepID=UPI0005A8BA03|nr:HAMP domain-containing sensor histidine kinase [Streptococcus agalactiae]HEO7970414.1 HAMP domain-containing histidine kinase [Streptococcus agalactiae]